MKEITILQLTTVHPRFDLRIHNKEAQTLASYLPHRVLMMVADGRGNVKEEQGRVSIHDIGSVRVGRVGRALMGTWRVFLGICRIKPAIIHFHDPELIPLGILLKVIGYRVIYDVHEDVPSQTLSKHYLPLVIRKPLACVIRAVESLGAKVFNGIIPATPKIAERFPAGKTVTIQNFPIASEMLLDKPIPYGVRPQSFVYAGLIASIRGIVEIVRAFELLGDIPGVRFDLAGTFSPNGFVDRLEELPGWKAVNYHGEVPMKKVVQLLGCARSGLVLHHPVPNEIDAQPIKMYEYMAAGLPVIASDFPLWRRIIDGAGCGLLVDPLNSQAIGEAMRWILTHPAEAEAMGKRGREAVERGYNWDVEATKLVSLYKKLLPP